MQTPATPITIPQFARLLDHIKAISSTNHDTATYLAKMLLTWIGKEDRCNHCDCCKPPLAKFIEILTQELEKRRLDDSTDEEIYAAIQQIPLSKHDLIHSTCKYFLKRLGIYMDWQATNDAMVDRVKLEMVKRNIKPLISKQEIAQKAIRMRRFWLDGNKDVAVSFAKEIVTALGYNSMNSSETPAEFILRASTLVDGYVQ